MKTVILTRPAIALEQAKEVYASAGFAVHLASCFKIETNSSVKTEWLSLQADVWVILSVHALRHALIIQPDLKPSPNTRVIAVGPAVEKKWHQYFQHPITSPASMNSEGVIELIQALTPKINSIKILTTANGRDLIKSFSTKRCISYHQINTYQRINLAVDIKALKRLYSNSIKLSDVASNEVILTATSQGILSAFMNQLDDAFSEQIKKMPLIVGAQRIKAFAQQCGFTNIYLADNPSDRAMCACALSLVKA